MKIFPFIGAERANHPVAITRRVHDDHIVGLEPDAHVIESAPSVERLHGYDGPIAAPYERVRGAYT